METCDDFLDFEVWKPIECYEYYEVSNLGRVRSLDRFVTQKKDGTEYARLMKGRLLKPRLQNGGYLVVWLCSNGVSRAVTVHRLVALAFLGDSNGLDVNHKNGDKQDNRLENLEYVSRRVNIDHSYNVLNRKRLPGKPFRCVESGEVFQTLSDASKRLNIGKCSISSVLHGRNKTANNLHFEYI